VSAERISRSSGLLAAAMAIAAVCGDWAFQRVLPIDLAIASALNMAPKGISQPAWVAEAVVLGAAATVIANRLNPQARVIVTVQLVLLGAVTQFAAAHYGGIAPRFVGMLLAIAAGFGIGLYVRNTERAKQRSATQYQQVALKNKELFEARLQLVKQDEVERRILAGDLHDIVLNDLKMLRQQLQPHKETMGEKAEGIDSLLAKAMTEIRAVMDNLSPHDLEHLGLVGAIEECLDKGAEKANFKVRFRSELDDSDIEGWNPMQQTLMYRLVQESVNNIVKHSGAKTVTCRITKEAGTALFTLEDDGKGIDPTTFKTESRGLRYMRQRADLIGGAIAWRKGKEDKGTVVEISVPIAAAPPAAIRSTGATES
jgi:signal transduction histidine kinase